MQTKIYEASRQAMCNFLKIMIFETYLHVSFHSLSSKGEIALENFSSTRSQVEKWLTIFPLLTQEFPLFL